MNKCSFHIVNYVFGLQKVFHFEFEYIILQLLQIRIEFFHVICITWNLYVSVFLQLVYVVIKRIIVYFFLCLATEYILWLQSIKMIVEKSFNLITTKYFKNPKIMTFIQYYDYLHMPMWSNESCNVVP